MFCEELGNFPLIEDFERCEQAGIGLVPCTTEVPVRAKLEAALECLEKAMDPRGRFWIVTQVPAEGSHRDIGRHKNEVHPGIVRHLGICLGH
jgi:hypothetical protein